MPRPCSSDSKAFFKWSHEFSATQLTWVQFSVVAKELGKFVEKILATPSVRQTCEISARFGKKLYSSWIKPLTLTVVPWGSASRVDGSVGGPQDRLPVGADTQKFGHRLKPYFEIKLGGDSKQKNWVDQKFLNYVSYFWNLSPFYVSSQGWSDWTGKLQFETRVRKCFISGPKAQLKSLGLHWRKPKLHKDWAKLKQRMQNEICGGSNFFSRGCIFTFSHFFRFSNFELWLKINY